MISAFIDSLLTRFAASGRPGKGVDTQLLNFGNGGPTVTPVPYSARLDLLERFRERARP